MAEYTYVPQSPPGRIFREIGPPTLRTEYEDGGLDVRQKSATRKLHVIDPEAIMTDAEVATLRTLFDSKGYGTTTTIVSYHPDEVGGHELTVRFWQFPEILVVCPDVNLVRGLEWREA